MILAKTELQCETNPDLHDETGAVGCRTFIFAFNQFIHKHRKDFVFDGKNLKLLMDAFDKIPDEQLPANLSQVTEQYVEIAFQGVEKKQLDKKPKWASGEDVF